MNYSTTLYTITAAILFKFAIEARAGAYSYCQPGHFTRYANDRYTAEGVARNITPQAYRRWFVCKWLAACTLALGGWLSAAAAAVLAAWFLAIEPRYDYKHHTLFIGVACAFVSLVAPTGLLLEGPQHSPEAQLLLTSVLVAVLVQVYLSSAWIKILSPMFRSGLVLANLFDYLAVEQQRFRITETYIPVELIRHIERISDTPSYSRLWKTLAWATIATEALVAGLLLVPHCRPYGMSLGIVMHFAFTLILPRRLLPFLLATVGLYEGLR